MKRACFQNSLLYANKSLERRMFPDKVLGKNAFKTSNDETLNYYEGELTSMIFIVFNKEKTNWAIVKRYEKRH